MRVELYKKDGLEGRFWLFEMVMRFKRLFTSLYMF